MSYSSTGPVPAVLLWVWLLFAGILIGLPVLIIVVAVALRRRASRKAFGQDSGPGAAARSHAHRVTRSGLAGLAAGVLLALILVLDGRADLAPLGVAGGYLAGLLAGEFAAQPAREGQVRAASLRARKPADYAPRWAVLTALAAVGLIIAAVIAFAVAPSIGYGPWHPYPGSPFTLPGGRTSWPAWPGTATGALVAMLVLLLGAAGIRRVADRPQLTDAAEQTVDELLRRQSGRAITGGVLSLQLIMLGGLLIAGSDGLSVPVRAISGGAYLGSEAMTLAGVTCAVAGAVSWLVLSGWTRRPRPEATAGQTATTGG